jgi:hypothetical protein
MTLSQKHCTICSGTFIGRKNQVVCSIDCRRAHKKVVADKWHKANPERAKDGILRRTYGITIGQYYSMLANQSGACAICGSKDPGRYERFVVDHCHSTGEVRGLLCHHCNLMLGHARDLEATLTKAIKYLREHSVYFGETLCHIP